MFRGKIIIPLNEIVRIEKRTVDSLLFSYKTVCYFLYSKDTQIAIYLKEGKQYPELDHLFEGLMYTK